MKITLNRAAFQEALALVTSIMPSRTPKPILQCLLIIAGEDDVRICGTDLEVGINYRISQVEIEQKGDVVLPANKLAAIICESFDEVICLEAANGSCHITGTDSHFTMYGQESSRYPTVPSFEGKADVEVGLSQLQEGIEQSLFAAAKESTRYAINGVLWEIKGKKLFLVATDGRRLVRRKVDLLSAPTGEKSERRIIVPVKTMALLDRISASKDDKVAIRIVDNQVLIGCADVVVSSNLVEGNFPKYEEIIPADYERKLELDTEAVLSAVRRAAILTNEDSKGIKLAVGKKTMLFSGRAPETGDAQIEMAVEYKGEPIEIGFNPQFLIDVLRVIRTEKFEIELGQADRPGLIKSGADLLYVVMPINL